MKTIFHDNKNHSKFQKEASRIINKELQCFIGKKNMNRIKSIHIHFMYRWSKNTKRKGNKNRNLDFKLWDEEKKEIHIWIAPSWTKRMIDLRYGLRHEMVHIKDVMEDNLIILSEVPFKAKYRKNKNQEYKIYTKIPNGKIQEEKYEKSWNSFVNYVSQFFPWERKAHMVSCEK